MSINIYRRVKMAIYLSGKEITKSEKGKQLPKLDILSAMAVLDNIRNYNRKKQNKQVMKCSNSELKRNKNKKGKSI